MADSDPVFRRFRNTRDDSIADARPFEPLDVQAVERGYITVTPLERARGSPREGDFVVRDPTTLEQWIVTEEVFAASFSPEDPEDLGEDDPES